MQLEGTKQIVFPKNDRFKIAEDVEGDVEFFTMYLDTDVEAKDICTKFSKPHMFEDVDRLDANAAMAYVACMRLLEHSQPDYNWLVGELEDLIKDTVHGIATDEDSYHIRHTFKEMLSA